jgi:hypothetical protein
VASVAERNGCAQQPLAATCDAAQLVQHLLHVRNHDMFNSGEPCVETLRLRSSP